MKNGYISLHRKIQDHWIYEEKPFSKFQAFIDILMQVNHADQKVCIGNVLILCKRGESLNSLETWADRWGWEKSKVRRFLVLLKTDLIIDLSSCTKTTHLKVLNYDTYQNERNTRNPNANKLCTENETHSHQINQKSKHLTAGNSNSYDDWRNADETQMKRKCNASETRATPNNNDNNVNNENNNNTYTQPARKNDLPCTAKFTLKEVLDAAFLAGVADDKATDFFHHYNQQGWLRGNGLAIVDVVSALTQWRNNQFRFDKGKNNGRETVSIGSGTGQKFAEQKSQRTDFEIGD